jgi:DNA mismatch repair ATPase MutS
MNSIASYFENIKDTKSFFIDDITWSDLNMKEIFGRINNTQSSVGEEVLYNILRQPLFDEAEMHKRDSVIRYFECNDKERIKIQYIIAKLGRNRRDCISDFFTKESTHSNRLAYYRILASIPVISIGLIFITKIAILLFILSIAVNSFLHFLLFRKNEYQMQRFNYAISLVRCAEKIASLQIDEIKGYFSTVEDSISSFKSIKKMFFTFFDPDVINDMNIITDYIKMFFLIDAIKFEKVNLIVEEHRNDLKSIYEFVGTIDSFISIASYRKSLTYYTKPILGNCDESKHLIFKEIYHPLISEPVSNSGEINKSILITGSNASGKSTFLKTVAINSILAQTIYTCLATEYKSSYFKTYTSMALRDDIIGNDSYYIVEIKSLKRIMENINDKVPCLCIIDEILRGTNTVERISASSEVLNYIANSNCICISATHDVELTSILNKIFENYHFQENITREQIAFDYKLYPGRSETRNAIKLLNIMGYSSDIVSRAENRAKSFLENGCWNEIQ